MRLPYRTRTSSEAPVVVPGRLVWPEKSVADFQSEDETESGVKTLTRKVFKTVLFNDEDHTYDYVVEMLTKCCELSREAAFRCAVEVDLTERTIVYYGGHEECLLMAQKIQDYGPDHRLPHSIGSMNAEVQGH